MDKIILGLLMIKHLTIYEIRNIIKANLQSMCSDSMGSIQAAIKKLLANDMIIFNEFVENCVNKKVYSITPKGREYFSEWVCTPMSTSKMKNMELSKLFFMGLAPKDKRIELIDASVLEMKEDLAYLKTIQSAIGDTNLKIDAYVADVKSDKEMYKSLLNSSKCSSIEESVKDVSLYNKLTLKLGIDMSEFQISWYENLKDKIIKGEDLFS